MIKNRFRGEVTANLDGRDWQLCLTLGALAELEAKMGAQDISALAKRFSSGNLSASDMRNIIAVGLRGGGHDVSDAEVGEMRCENGLTGYAQIVAELLSATFFVTPEETGEASNPNPSGPQNASSFPGK